MRDHYTGDKYHLLDFNCNSFTADVSGEVRAGAQSSTDAVAYLRSLAFSPADPSQTGSPVGSPAQATQSR